MASIASSTRSKNVAAETWLSQSTTQINYSNETGRRTETPAWHKDKELHSEVTVDPWTGFDQFISSVKTRINTQTITHNLLCQCLNTTGKDNIILDTITCGSESSVQGRFLDRVMRPLDLIMSEFEKTCESGDFYIFHKDRRRLCGRARNAPTSSEDLDLWSAEDVKHSPTNSTSHALQSDPDSILDSLAQLNLSSGDLSVSPPSTSAFDLLEKITPYRRVPDIICTKMMGRSSFSVGEVKVPWLHDLDVLSNLHQPSHSVSKDTRMWLAQICEYMSDLKLKYGFLTTYEATVFLKFEREDKTSKNTIRVRCSPVVTWNGQGAQKSQIFKGGFSQHNLRQAMFYMMYHCYSKKKSKYRTGHHRPVVLRSLPGE